MDTPATSSIQSLKNMVEWFERKEIILKIPELQRNYVWGPIQWEQLWSDILNVWKKCQNINEQSDKKPQHFMGIITLKKGDTCNMYDILDGQQRMTTLKILTDYLCDLIRVKNCTYEKEIGIKIEQLNVQPVGNIFRENRKSEEKYEEVYNYFASLYAVSGEVNPEELMQVIENRLFWLIHFSEDDKYEVFEAINATGKPLEYADLLLNYLLERNHEEGTGVTEGELENRWNTILDQIFKSELPESSTTVDADSSEDHIICEEEIEEVEVEEVSEGNIGDDSEQNQMGDEEVIIKETIKKPLKLKKFLSALHCLTLPKTESLSESVEDFEKIFIRLKELNQGQELTTQFILESMEYWSKLYLTCVEPVSNRHFKDKIFEEELYYLSILGNANYIPIILRVLDKFNRDIYKEDVVKSILGAVIRYKIYSEIYMERENSNEAEKKIILLDYIVDALKLKEVNIDIAVVFSVLNQDKNTYSNIKNDSDQCNKQGDVLDKIKILKYPYNSKISKLILAIDYQRNTKHLLLESENKDNLFQVEHMVAKMVKGGYFEYGCDDISINQFCNLILLERNINIAVSNKKPLDKLNLKNADKDSGWKASVLYDYYEQYIDEKIIESNESTFIDKQTDRLKKLVKAICEYLLEVFPGDTKSNMDITKDSKELYFLQANRYYGQYIGITSNITVDSNSANAEKYLFVLTENRIKRYPEPSENITIEYHFSLKGKHNSTVSELFKVYKLKESSGKKKYGLALFIHLMITMYNINEKGELIYDEIPELKHVIIDFDKNKEVYDIITELAEKKGENGAKSGEILFTDSNVNNNDIRIDDRMKGYIKDDNLKYKLKCKIDEYHYIYSNLNTDPNVTAIGLREIYRLYHEKTKQSFGFWTEMAEPEMHYINGIRRFIPFRNIGDEKLFTEFVEMWVKDRESEESQTSQNEKVESTSIKVEEVESYFKCENQKFEELAKKEFNIPIYQRAYVWGKSNHESLWNSIIDAIVLNKEELNLGTIILYGNSIVDGQQRLTTLAILYKLITQENAVKLYNALFDENNDVKKYAKKYYEEKIKGLKEEEKVKLIQALGEIQFSILEINNKTPKIYQYVVFSAINGKGKKLTVQEKIKNLLLKYYQSLVALDNVKLISETEGFLKAFMECQGTRHISETELYDEFREWIYKNKPKFEDLLNNCKCYRYIKGMTNSNRPDFIEQSQNADEKYKKFIINLKLYQQLNVNTADALILFHFTNSELKLEDATNLLHRLNVLYFLLYVDDPNGNGKKSVNSKLPELIALKSVEIFANNKLDNQQKYIITDDILYTSKNVTEYIWNKIITIDLTRTMRVNVSRFILMLVELWMGMDINTAYEILETKRNKKYSILDKSEIEHIFPANPDDFPKDVQPPNYLFRLENVCLLEGDINKSVGNAVLSIPEDDEKNKNKLGKYGEDNKILDEDKKYKSSVYLMPQMFYDKNNDKNDKARYLNRDFVCINKNKDRRVYYTDTMAKKRIEKIKEVVDTKELFKNDLASILLPETEQKS